MIGNRANKIGQLLYVLVEKFVNDDISAEEFETEYLRERHKSRGLRFGKFGDFDLQVFSAVDAFCGDPQLRGPEDLDQAGLLHEVEEALRQFKEG